MDMGGFNPMTMGFLAAALGQNPELAGYMDQMGIPAPDGSVAMPGITMGGGPLGGALTGQPTMPQMGGPPVAPGMAPGMIPGMGVPGTAGPMSGFKPSGVSPPIMSGGVAGSQKAPDPKATKGAPQAIEALLAMMGGGPQRPSPVGTLGSFLRQGGGRY